ncbi:MAG: hypothetical protein ACOH13_14835 [Flavobacteriales bacterium]
MDTLLILVIGLIAGIVLYYLDLGRGRRWNTRWYDLTHKEKSPMLLEQGLIHKQPFQQKLVMAIVIAGLYTASAIALGGAHALIDLIRGATLVVGLMLGFYAAVFLFKGRRWNMDPVVNAMHKVDALENSLNDPKPTIQTNAPVIEKPEPPKSPEPTPDWREGVKKFGKR